MYNPDKKEWNMTVSARPSLTATAKSEYGSLVLGTHNWIVNNDTDCQEETVDKKITLSSCNNGGWKRIRNETTLKWEWGFEEAEFTCKNGLCVDIGKRCDGKVDCKVISLTLLVPEALVFEVHDLFRGPYKKFWNPQKHFQLFLTSKFHFDVP